MSDKVFVEGLKMSTVIGVYDWEREIQQSLIMDLVLDWDNRPAAKSDDISLALDYDKLSKFIVAYVESTAFELIETVAEEVAERVINEFHVPKLTLKLSKPDAVANAKNVAVQITREQG